MKEIKTNTVVVGGRNGSVPVTIGSAHPIVVQTMCNTPTANVTATLEQCVRLAGAGAQMIRITVPSLSDLAPLGETIRELRSRNIGVPIVADVHFSSEIAIQAAKLVDKVRINPGNFHPDHDKARERFREFLGVCRENGCAIRIGVNHGSLGKYIVDKFGGGPEGMAQAAMEWVQMCLDNDFHNAVVSLKSSNTVVMVEAYRRLVALMQEAGEVFPLHLGVTEAGNGDMGRIKSCVAISTLLEEGIGNTIRVSLTEAPENELPTAYYLANRYGVPHQFRPVGTAKEEKLWKASCDAGPSLMNHTADDLPADASFPELHDMIMQACRRKFYAPEYIACPGCGRTKYNLEECFEEVKKATRGLGKNVVIAVMGCIVNGPGEMADADYGYVGEGEGKVTLYKGKTPVMQHVPQTEAVEKLVELIRQDGNN